MEQSPINAQVIAVFPDKVRIVVDNLENFKLAEESLKVGSHLKIADNDNALLIAIIENFQISVGDGKRDYIIEAFPLGILRDGKFERGGDSLAIPPKEVLPASIEEIKAIYDSVPVERSFCFSSLSTNSSVRVPIDGNKFFNKHIAIVGSTGSGKSHTLAKIIQTAVQGKSGEFALNNSHVIIFDVHSEYRSAFPDAAYIDVSNLVLPYWMLNSEELEEFFLDTEANDHNQRNIFKEAIIQDRRARFQGTEEDRQNIHLDSPLLFDIRAVLKYAQDKNIEMVDTGEVYAASNKEKAGQPKFGQGSLHGKLTNFVNRLENKVNDKRLDFFLGENSRNVTFETALQRLLGYSEGAKSNVTVIDLSGVPFDVLSITVSLISRLVFEYGYFYKRLRCARNPDEKINNDVPILLVYEEAHKYVPNSELSKYRSSKISIERIAKEGRKYGVTLLLASQRPSEISETIFSQCNNFIAMRLTNPVDQGYVKKLLPDSLGSLIEKMTSFRQGEALLVGEAVVLPSIVQIDPCTQAPSSNDIPYWELWKEEWKEMDIAAIKREWYK